MTVRAHEDNSGKQETDEKKYRMLLESFDL